MQILIVDSPQSDVSDLDSFLRLAGHYVLSVEDIDSAVRSVSRCDVALILIASERDSVEVESIRSKLRRVGYSNSILHVTGSYVHRNGRSAETAGG